MENTSNNTQSQNQPFYKKFLQEKYIVALGTIVSLIIGIISIMPILAAISDTTLEFEVSKHDSIGRNDVIKLIAKSELTKNVNDMVIKINGVEKKEGLTKKQKDAVVWWELSGNELHGMDSSSGVRTVEVKLYSKKKTDLSKEITFGLYSKYQINIPPVDSKTLQEKEQVAITKADLGETKSLLDDICLTGQVVDETGSPLSGVKLQIEGKLLETSDEGTYNFIFPANVKNFRLNSAKKEGYLTFTKDELSIKHHNDCYEVETIKLRRPELSLILVCKQTKQPLSNPQIYTILQPSKGKLKFNDTTEIFTLVVNESAMQDGLNITLIIENKELNTKIKKELVKLKNQISLITFDNPVEIEIDCEEMFKNEQKKKGAY